MISFSTFGIFVLLFAYCTPSQDQVISVAEVAFENGKSYKSTNLIKLSNGKYKIEGVEHEFGIEGVDTMLGKDVLLRANDNTWIKVELVNSQDSEQLFTMTTRPKLGDCLFSYRLSAVYEYKQNRPLVNKLLSVFKYSTTGKLQHRFVIHSGEPLSSELEPHLFWTENDFNYFAYNNSIVLTLRPDPAKETNKYYLVKFRGTFNLRPWLAGYGRHYESDIPPEPNAVYDYFLKFIKER